MPMPTPRSIAALALALPVLASSPALGDLTLAPLFTDHMVLQQRAECPVWGWERPGVEVTIRASWGQTATATADGNGRWLTTLQTPEAGGPHEIAITGDTGTTLRDVYAGEVWLASGQSNMEWPLRATDTGAQDIAAANHPTIRFFTVPNTISLHPRVDADAQWTIVSPETAPNLSAVAYHFARGISAVDSNRMGLAVPVGIIAADWGGTRIEAWMDAEALSAFEAYAGELHTIDLLKDPATRAPLMADAEQAWWNRLDSLPGQPGDAWTTLGFDDSGWGTMDLPASWTGDLANFDGIVRFRRTVELPPAWDGRPAIIELGPIDDRDDVWINGTYIAGTRRDGAWQIARRYDIPAGVLRAGANAICVRAYDTGGLGGINGQPAQMRLLPQEAAGSNPAVREPVGLAGPWRFLRGTAVADLPPQSQPVQINQNTATALYNAMIHPLAPYKIRGVIWYQGESNRNVAGRYAGLMRGWIANWRAAFNDPNLPFYWVQIAPYGYANDRGETVALREAQQHATSEPHTGMVVTTDIGDNADIHPRNKRDVGHRLALLALRDTYGNRDVVASGPAFQSMRPGAAGEAIVEFAHADGLAHTSGPGGLSGFEVAGDDRRFHAVTGATVRGASVVLRCPEVARPVAVRFNWTRSPEANLANAQGLPAAPFRTDDWPAETVSRDEESFLAPLRDDDSVFVDLFNGQNLSGWHIVNGDVSTWTVARDDDGPYIRCSGIPTGVMRTDRHEENFVLEMEYRHMVPGGNAGLFVWSDPLPVRGAPFTRSVEVQVMDGQEGNGFTSDGDIFPIWGATMTPVNGRGGSRAFPTERRSNPAPMWNHYRVECVDGAITLWLNGKVITRGHSISPRRGYICLESEGSEVHFRNIRIKRLPPASPALTPDQIAATAQGFRPLYNGVDLDEWNVTEEHEGHWTPRDWRLVFDGQGTDLWSKESFGDFEMICDWRWTDTPVETQRPIILPDGSMQTNEDGSQAMVAVMDAGDSGIYLRGSSKSQVNIWCWPIGSGEVYGYRTDASMPPEVRAGVTPRVVADNPIGQWNRFHITIRGDRLTVVLNGQTVLEDALLPGVAAQGPIALQRHGNPIEFANIYIRPLD